MVGCRFQGIVRSPTYARLSPPYAREPRDLRRPVTTGSAPGAWRKIAAPHRQSDAVLMTDRLVEAMDTAWQAS